MALLYQMPKGYKEGTMSIFESLTREIEYRIQLTQQTKVSVHWHIAQQLIERRDNLTLEAAEREIIQL